jgi:hypothetical protein
MIHTLCRTSGLGCVVDYTNVEWNFSTTPIGVLYWKLATLLLNADWIHDEASWTKRKKIINCQRIFIWHYTLSTVYRLEHIAVLDKNCAKKRKTLSPLRAMQAPRGRYSSYSFMTSALDGVSGQRHAPAASYPRVMISGNHWVGNWVGFRGYRKNLCF